MKKLILLFLTGAILIICGTSITKGSLYAKKIYWNLLDKMIVNNNLKTDTVDFNLNIINIDNKKTFMPGEKVKEIIRITNKGIPCFLRVKGGFRDNNTQAFLVNSNWVKNGEYFYYKDILKEGEAVDFSNCIKIPENLNNSWKNKNLPMELKVEGVQENNIIPDLKSKSPWFGVQIEKSIHSAIHPISLGKTYSNLNVIFDGKTNKIISNSNDFFANIKNLSPGDKIRDTIHINNSENKKVKICIKVDDNSNNDNNEFMKKVKLSLSDDNKLIYKGPLYSNSNKGEISLGVFSPKEKKNLNFCLEMPKEMGNKYTEEEENIKWKFTAYDFQEPGEEPKEIKGNYDSEIDMADEVKTGDYNSFTEYKILIFVSALTFLFFAFKKIGGMRQ